MNEAEIRKMPAGREMDGRIAELVMGIRIFWNVPNIEGGVSLFSAPELAYRVPDYSTDIAAAWEVTNEMQALNHWVLLMILSSSSQAVFVEAKSGNRFETEAGVNEIPLAICRASLLATRVVETTERETNGTRD